MKIKEFLITRYGPLKYRTPFQLKDFNVLWGRNEEGKTLTIDALIKILVGQKSKKDKEGIKSFENIYRVEETPEGYLILEDDSGKEIKLPEKRGDLKNIIELTPREFRNIFIIRNSDLSISQENEFYTNVTTRLLGLRTKEISEIKNVLKDIGKLTQASSNADLSDTYDKIKSRLREAEGLIKKITGLMKKIEEEGLDELEVKYVMNNQMIKVKEIEMEALEDARKREKYEKGKEALRKLQDSLAKLKDMEIYNEEDGRLWRDCEREIRKYEEDKRKTCEELQKNSEELARISEELKEEERNFRIIDGRKRELDSFVKPELEIYKEKHRKLMERREEIKFFKFILMISAIMFGISLCGIILKPSLFFFILTVMFFISGLISAGLWLKFTLDEAALAGNFYKIKSNISRFEISGQNIDEIVSGIQKFEEDYMRRADKLQEIRRRKENLEEKIDELQNKRIPDIEGQIKYAEDEIGRIKIKSRVDSLEEYMQKLKFKREVEKSIGELTSILKSHFGEKSEKLNENILYWEEEIGKLEEYKEKSPGKKYSEFKFLELKKEKQKLEETQKEIDEKMEWLKKELREVEREANQILQEESLFFCDTLKDLEEVKNKLQKFRDENERNKSNVLEVIKIFEEIEAEEKEKVSELFGKGSPVSDYFREITDGFYEEVTFNQSKGKIEAKRKDGIILEAEKLSGGTYDQLYFSVRLALGEKLLKGKKGFFIMDDPFIKADPIRLKKQIEMLKRISKEGWQIIYFSAKGEIKELLAQEIRSGDINYIELEGKYL